MTPGQDTFTLSMTLSGTTTSRFWDIRISQIPCGATYAGIINCCSLLKVLKRFYFIAPADCLQYFMDVSGTVMSFNYLFSTVSPIQHLAFQDYTVCVRTNSVNFFFKIFKSIHKRKVIYSTIFFQRDTVVLNGLVAQAQVKIKTLNDKIIMISFIFFTK